MINLPFSETKENKEDQGLRHPHPRQNNNILGPSKHHSNSNSPDTHRRAYNKQPSLSPHSLDQNLAQQGWQNTGNGVYSHDNDICHHSNSGNVPSTEVFDKLHIGSSTQRRKGYSYSSSKEFVHQRHTSVPTSCITSSPNKDIPRHHNSTDFCSSSIPSHKRVSLIQRRYFFPTCAIILALIGTFVDVKRVMEVTSSAMKTGTVVTSKEWIKKLPHSFPSLASNGGSVSTNQSTFTGSAYSGSIHTSGKDLVGPNAVSMEEEWARVRELSRERARQRKTRTNPSVSTGKAATGMNAESMAPPSLVLDMPAHRPLDNELTNGATRELKDNNGLRRLEPAASLVCGSHAKEASQLNPSYYPESAALNSNSRVVVTGALSQLGMEVILSLHEQCGVSYIMGIDSAYPNTRHERIQMMEWRYKLLARRVPQFQRLLVPVFGIHPHPKVGEEVRYEAEGNSFSIMRFQPTHVVHLAGIEEGMGEHVDYGDTTDASPFASESSEMMRRFESLVSMDQVMSAFKQTGSPQPQLVYISSNEASARSGVAQAGGSPASSANVYGPISLSKEILASAYYRQHGINSVGLRIPLLLGPFDRPGSVIHDLAERTVRNAAGKNVKGVPKYHTEQDRFDLATILKKREGAAEGKLEQVAFASDVARAVVAALQFRGDDGPTIMRLGSKFTTSMRDIKERMEGYLPSYNQWESSGEVTSSFPLANRNNVITANSRGLSIHDADRNRDLIGWVHDTGLHAGTKAILAWHVLKAYPFGLPVTVPSHNAFRQLVADSFSIHDRHAVVPLPCASDCRWPGFCTSSPWDDVIDITKSLTESCQYVLYTVDLRPELVNMDKQSEPSQRHGWEGNFCKIAFVSSSSKLAKGLYGYAMIDGTPMHEWNGKYKDGYWFVVAIHGSLYSMNEAERSMAKLAPNRMFHDRVDKAMYINHRRVCLTTDQATGVMKHLEMKGRDRTDKKTIVTDDKKEMRVYLPPRAPRHSVFFTNRYTFPEGFDTSSARNLAKFVMTNMGIPESSDIRAQYHFYDLAGHYTRTNTGRSPNYQDFFQDNFFPYDFLRTTWLVHNLRSDEGRNLRCEMYQEHSLWGNFGMEDLSIGYVLATKKVRMTLGQMAAHEYEGPEEWYPLLVPKDPEDGVVRDGPVYLDYLESAQKTTKNEEGDELFITFLPQKRD